MEEDIKVLEEFIEEIKEILERIDDYTNLDIYAFPIDYKQTKALKNLIKGYKELEEKVNKYEKQIDLEWVEENYIEKSKVREKIEALDDIESEYSKKILNISKETATFTIFVQEILKQLLQEGDK